MRRKTLPPLLLLCLIACELQQNAGQNLSLQNPSGNEELTGFKPLSNENNRILFAVDAGETQEAFGILTCRNDAQNITLTLNSREVPWPCPPEADVCITVMANMVSGVLTQNGNALEIANLSEAAVASNLIKLSSTQPNLEVVIQVPSFSSEGYAEWLEDVLANTTFSGTLKYQGADTSLVCQKTGD